VLDPELDPAPLLLLVVPSSPLPSVEASPPPAMAVLFAPLQLDTSASAASAPRDAAQFK
jgi:hypothetical protein